MQGGSRHPKWGFSNKKKRPCNTLGVYVGSKGIMSHEVMAKDSTEVILRNSHVTTGEIIGRGTRAILHQSSYENSQQLESKESALDWANPRARPQETPAAS